MRIDIWSDVVCPWCYVGLANLDAALAEFEHADETDIVLHSFQLDPSAPRRDDQPIVERLAAKYGTSVGQIRASQARLVSLGAERGIDFRFDRAIGGNTFDAHRLLHLAARDGLQVELKHRLGRAYFTDGEPIGEPDTLRKAAVDVGLDPGEVDRVLAGDAWADEVRADLATAREIAITGVPFFVADGRLAVSGAQPAETLLGLLQEAWASRPTPLVEFAGASNAEGCGPEGCEL